LKFFAPDSLLIQLRHSVRLPDERNIVVFLVLCQGFEYWLREGSILDRFMRSSQ